MGAVQKPPFSAILAKAGIHKGWFLPDARIRGRGDLGQCFCFWTALNWKNLAFFGLLSNTRHRPEKQPCSRFKTFARCRLKSCDCRDAHYRKDANKENRKEKIESILMEPPPLSGSFVSALQEKENRKEAQAHSQADERPVSTNAKFQLNDLPPILWEV